MLHCYTVEFNALLALTSSVCMLVYFLVIFMHFVHINLFMCLFFSGAVYVKNRNFFPKKQSGCYEHSSLLHMAVQPRGNFVWFFLN